MITAVLALLLQVHPITVQPSSIGTPDVTLPSATSGVPFYTVKVLPGAATTTVRASGAETVDGAKTFSISAGGAVTFRAISGAWYVVSAYSTAVAGSGTPATAVVTETAFAQASAVGVSTDYARADHTHGTPTIADADVPNGITIDLATAATALAADPADCAANRYANAINASGTLSCSVLSDADVPNTITVDLATAATALAANPADCGANTFAQSIVAAGTLTCANVALNTADVTGTLSIGKGGTGLTAVGPAYSDLRTNAAANAAEWGQQTVVLASPVAVAVNATYVTIFTVQPILSKTNNIAFRIFHAASAATVGMQFRVSSADAGNVGTCSFLHMGITAAGAASAVDHWLVVTAIGAAPADTAALGTFNTTFNPVYIDCAFTSDGTPGTVLLEAQLETGTTSTNILAGSSYTYSFN